MWMGHHSVQNKQMYTSGQLIGISICLLPGMMALEGGHGQENLMMSSSIPEYF